MLINSHFRDNVWSQVRVGLLPARAMAGLRRGLLHNFELGLVGCLLPPFRQHFLVLVRILRSDQQLLSESSRSKSGHNFYRNGMLRKNVHYDYSRVRVSMGHRRDCTLHSYEVIRRSMVRMVNASNRYMVFPMGFELLYFNCPCIIFPMLWRNVIRGNARA